MLLKFQSKERAPGGSNKGIKATRNNKVIGVVFHIKLFNDSTSLVRCNYENFKEERKCLQELEAYAKAVQFSCCCKLDQRILLTALGIIHANATQAPKTSNWRSVTVATAIPIETTVNAST